MKLKFYMFFTFGLAAIVASAQTKAVLPDDQSYREKDKVTANDDYAKAKKAHATKGGEAAFWSEDFSNGLDGQDANGAWTTEGVQGGLWFKTFPPLSPNGYDPFGLIPEYGNVYPNYNDGLADDEIPFTTAENGFMMLDADRANSTQTDPDAPDPLATFLPVDAILVSPAIDLTGVDNAIITFWERWRMCCSNYNLSLDFSVDGGATWSPNNLNELTPNLVVPGSGGPFLEANPSINISSILQGATDLTDCRIRIAWDPAATQGASHYYAMFDDISITAVPEFDLELSNAAFDEWLRIITEEPVSAIDIPEGPTPIQEYYTNMEYAEYGVNQVRPLTFVGLVNNIGAQDMTNVILEVEVITPAGTENFSSDPITLAAGESAVITIDDIELDAYTSDDGSAEVGQYTVSFEVFADQDEGELTANNTVDDRLFQVSEERTYNGSSTDEFSGAYPDADDNEFFNMFTVVNDQPINYIQFALLDRSDVQNEPGEEIFLNIGEGALWGDDDAFPTFFGVDELDYEIQAESITQLEDDSIQWITLMLPDDESVTLEPGITYFTSLLVPPSSETEPIAIVAVMNEQENASGAWINYDEPGGAVQFALGSIVHALRAGFMDPLSSENYGPLNFSMEQNFPNPVVSNGSTRISWSLVEAAENISFSITDNTGKTIYQKDLGDRPVGAQEDIVLDNLGLAAGVYQYGIKVGNQRIVRKMMVTK